MERSDLCGIVSSLYSLGLLSDKRFLSIMFRLRMGYNIDWGNLRTICEKIQWLKLYDRKDEYTAMVDKVSVKDWAEKKIGREHIIPTLGVWDKPEDIDFSSLPSRFILKCSHSSGDNYIHASEDRPAAADIVKMLNEGLGRYNGNYFYHNGEWPYRNVRKRIIAEELLTDGSGHEVPDYKFWCFRGVPKMIQFDYDRFSGHNRILYDTDWNVLPVTLRYPAGDADVMKPSGLDEMLEIAGRLSEGILFVRVDLYNAGGHIYFGEMTFYPEGGFVGFCPDEWNHILGDLIDI